MKRVSAWSIRIGSLLFVLVALGWWWVTRTHAGSWWWAALLNMAPPQLLWPWPLLLAWRAARVGKRGWVVVNLLAAALFTVSTVGFVLPRAPRAPGAGRPLTVLSLNTNYASAPATKVAELALREGAQVVTLQEALDRQRSGKAFETQLRAAFPGWNVVRNDELLTLAHVPVLGWQVIKFPHSPHTLLLTRLRVEGQTVTVVNTHLTTFPLPLPLPQKGGRPVRTLQQRTEHQLQVRWDFQTVMAGLLRHSADPLVLAGDLNTPARGGVVHPLRFLGLSDAFAEAGTGFGFTHWAYLGHSRLDYIWLRGLQAQYAAPLPDLVSDHRALIARLRLPDPASAP
ncbi:endonuclease/exonuclease/phosphatase family protein [Deinococcus sp.]|uniref:endonuclease/exonuclease/phosphatase family protein n=1 Tax=Deinococcus sp. TaxID=47478 RepID=UPI0025BCD4A4|nr:endonuclease/exonuclease/phosphatase family protein [Deinococcus sp.]